MHYHHNFKSQSCCEFIFFSQYINILLFIFCNFGGFPVLFNFFFQSGFLFAQCMFYLAYFTVNFVYYMVIYLLIILVFRKKIQLIFLCKCAIQIVLFDCPWIYGTLVKFIFVGSVFSSWCYTYYVCFFYTNYIRKIKIVVKYATAALAAASLYNIHFTLKGGFREC